MPQFRKNCIMQGKKEDLSKFKVGDTIFLISDLPTKNRGSHKCFKRTRYNY